MIWWREEYESERGEETMGSQGIGGIRGRREVVPRKPNKILIRYFECFTSTGFNRTIPIS